METKIESKTGISYPYDKEYIILLENRPSVSVVVLYVERKINSITLTAQKESSIRLREICSSMKYGQKSLTRKTKREH